MAGRFWPAKKAPAKQAAPPKKAAAKKEESSDHSASDSEDDKPPAPVKKEEPKKEESSDDDEMSEEEEPKKAGRAACAAENSYRQETEWHTDGSEYIGLDVLRVVTYNDGRVGEEGGSITGWLSADESDFVTDQGEAAPLWHVVFDDTALGEEDLEEHEVKEAVLAARSKKQETAVIRLQKTSGKEAWDHPAGRGGGGGGLHANVAVSGR